MKIIQHAQQLVDIESALKKILTPPLNKHVSVMSLKHGILQVGVDSVSWGAKLRFQVPDILSRLRSEFKYAGIIQIRYKISVPIMVKKKKPRKKIRPDVPEDVVDGLSKLAENTQNSKLKKSLLRFISHRKKDS